MADAYEPKLATFSLTVAEDAAVEAAMKTAKPWAEKNGEIKSVKKKIRDLHLARHWDTCCYCRRDLEDGGYFMIDREHILPKGKYKPYTFSIWNLSVSCKRCNMQFKEECDAFVVDKSVTAPFETSENYRFVHPNFDDWDDHLTRETVQYNKAVMVKFTVKEDSEKGRYTYDYFAFKRMEKDSFDRAQGVHRKSTESQSDAVLEAQAIAGEAHQ